MGAKFASLMKDANALLLGRRTYVTHAQAFEPMAPGDPFGDLMNAPAKYVVSKTLEKPIWRNTTVIRDDVVDALRALKASRNRTGSLRRRSSRSLLLRGNRRWQPRRLTPPGCRGRLDRLQHAMAGDRVVECRTEMGSFAIVAGKTRVRLGDVGARALRRRPPVLLRHGQDLERGLRALAAADGQLEDLGLAAGGGELEIALGAVDLPEHVGAARTPAAIVDGERGPALEQPGHAHLIVRGHGLAFGRSRDGEGLPAHGHGGRELSNLAEAVTERL